MDSSISVASSLDDTMWDRWYEARQLEGSSSKAWRHLFSASSVWRYLERTIATWISHNESDVSLLSRDRDQSSASEISWLESWPSRAETCFSVLSLSF